MEKKQELIDAVVLMLTSKTENTNLRYICALNDWLEFLGNRDPYKATSRDAMAYISSLYKRTAPDGKRWADATIQNQHNALHSIYETMLEAQMIKINPFTAARRLVNWRQHNLKRPTKLIKFCDIMPIIEAIDKSPDGLRDRALLAILFGCGLRRSELVNLRVGDIKLSEKNTVYLFIRQAKGGVMRKQPVPRWAYDHVRRLVTSRNQDGFNHCVEECFIFVSHYGKNAGVWPIGASTVYRIYKQYMDAAPHSARATFATALLEADFSQREVADALGHKSTHMVQVYDKRERSVDTNVGALVNYQK